MNRRFFPVMMTGMILPKGIVFNRNTIYEEIAKYDIVPLEQIHAACHVFTTTSRELVDPTARRLENFWTRVLGGDRRYLPGRVIARLFKSISEEESFVKLRGPPNRYEPPSPDSHVQTPVGFNATKSETPGGGPSKPASKGPAKSTKNAPPSSTKQPHPILKKPRGPSSSGPRPTARFVSPPGSDGEDGGDGDGKDAELGSSGSTAVNTSGDSRGSNNSIVREEKKKVASSASKKKSAAFVASTTTKRRPAMPRRGSSQPATAAGGSENGSKEGSPSSGSRQPVPQNSAPMITGKSGQAASSTTKEGGERLSSKAAGKRPASQPPDKPTASKPSVPKLSIARTSTVRSQLSAASSESRSAKQPEPAAHGKSQALVKDFGRTKVGQGGTAHRRSDTQERPRPNIPQAMARSRSDTGSSRRSSQDLTRRAPPQNWVASSTALVDTATAQGTIIEFDENPSVAESISGMLRENEEDVETGTRRSRSLVLDTRFTPTQPSATPAVPLGRSKSQLTLLLERQGERKPRR
ncbi:hypothetical protein GGS23DRAFT_599198 [Durotheca rogersii]|uniref:uncharacterized protein n=1 Tax=Durotheca rogersii TaxID=419775 RepID=UPI00221EEAF5|nr:uncharacterized protein GGS23DRAFT_599198 [Durotheca rogersii]KAI5860678.1 hypothetical protein GGS23DRAFT_599198 [Durotheca rogersii]